MRICVFGAGSVGGHLAAKFAAAGHAVSVVARGANLAAIQANGIALREGAPTPEGPAGITARLAARKGLYSPP